MVRWVPLVAIGAYLYATSSGGDAHAYWAATGYGIVDQRDAFLYSPPALMALQPFHILPWDWFHALFLAGQLAVLGWMAGPLLSVLLILPGPYSPVFVDLYFGNVMLYTAAATVAGFRHAGWWALLPFGKITPGIAMLWNGPRPMIAAAAVVLVTLVMAPHLYAAWLHTLIASEGVQPLAGLLIPRLVVAAGLVFLGRWRGWRWTLPLAVTLAQPVFWFTSLAILTGWFYLLRHRAAGAMLRSPARSASSERAVPGSIPGQPPAQHALRRGTFAGLPLPRRHG